MIGMMIELAISLKLYIIRENKLQHNHSIYILKYINQSFNFEFELGFLKGETF